ncbi:MAG: ABC transporter permease [Pseudodesulfovibrio sp.]|uniref:Binding-protein-dependent transport systems inner membrane component n=1 Tax=Pseudodesulfovibrio aespoeensis (strain ATCC 700646 / DSM 10631 / Aspo-2) TaxID=643562 RepID=E6VWB1_PSEA9|nr:MULTISPECIES: ABC transporter permease [Pseudodesulfovibrio]MBU4193029.1 ABC transporter permease [Pseudomonadota bacterium]ADU61317.1 binding-protein-dependent transport systems inner membrane component [Pseudodesulfovibrio aespoeensis Aspo-2]MBU4244546.1 ABC transporter permease [Pseudomonadota bacterium]MBU4379672.1 ABC transporter permease [Pseudomonadota bacterium]MBU4475407.1 ABC transporter permease [Pseudomonadota bacterium]
MRSIARFLAAKLARLTLLLSAVAVLSFVLVSFSPVDPIDAYLGPSILKVSPEQRERIAERWGLDRPATERLARWAGQLARGNFGESTIFNEPVLSVIGKRFAASFWLMLLAWSFSGVLGFALGLVAGAREGSRVDRAIRLYAYTMASTPTFWVGMVLLTFFSVQLGWTPVCCAGPVGMDPADVPLLTRLHHLLLPAVTLSLIGVAQIALHTREKTIEAMHSDYVLFARAQGDTTRGIVLRHALRNVMLPAVTLQFASLGELFGGAVLAEQVFSYPGLGRATVEAGYRGDVPLLLGIVLFSAVFVFVGNMIADLLYLVVDPRMRDAGREGV